MGYRHFQIKQTLEITYPAQPKTVPLQRLRVVMNDRQNFLNFAKHNRGISKKCHERPECKADGAQKPERTDST
jgi:hypothetical protein